MTTPIRSSSGDRGQAARLAEEAQQLLRRHVGIERAVLGKVADLRRRLEAVPPDIEPGDRTDPDVGAMKPVRILMVVVLPAPLGPSMATICPRGMSKERSATAAYAP